MNQSDSIGNLAKALCIVQGALQAVTKDNKVNAGSMKYSYASLPDVMAGCRELLSKNGIAVMQTFAPAEGNHVTLITLLMHESGEWRDSWLTLPVPQGTAQAFGSAITYARRYGLMAAVGIVTDDDDDGEKASIIPAYSQQRPPQPKAPAPVRADGSRMGTSDQMEAQLVPARKRVFALLNECYPSCVGDSEDAKAKRKGVASGILGRPVSSFTHLTVTDLQTIARVLDEQLEGMSHAGINPGSAYAPDADGKLLDVPAVPVTVGHGH